MNGTEYSVETSFSDCIQPFSLQNKMKNVILSIDKTSEESPRKNYVTFLNLKLFDRSHIGEPIEPDREELSDSEKVVAILKMEGPKPVKEPQNVLKYLSRSQF